MDSVRTPPRGQSESGESAQAAKILKRVVQLSPMDMAARTKLIDQLVARGQVDDAIRPLQQALQPQHLVFCSLESRFARSGGLAAVVAGAVIAPIRHLMQLNEKLKTSRLW